MFSLFLGDEECLCLVGRVIPRTDIVFEDSLESAFLVLRGILFRFQGFFFPREGDLVLEGGVIRGETRDDALGFLDTALDARKGAFLVGKVLFAFRDLLLEGFLFLENPEFCLEVMTGDFLGLGFFFLLVDLLLLGSRLEEDWSMAFEFLCQGKDVRLVLFLCFLGQVIEAREGFDLLRVLVSG